MPRWTQSSIGMLYRINYNVHIRRKNGGCDRCQLKSINRRRIGGKAICTIASDNACDNKRKPLVIKGDTELDKTKLLLTMMDMHE